MKTSDSFDRHARLKGLNAKHRPRATPFMVIVMAASLFVTQTTVASERKWCGTDGKSWQGVASKLIPEYFPPQENKKCRFRRAPIREACREHDRCYWDLTTTKEHCDDKFVDDLKRICRKLTEPYTLIGIKLPPPARCHTLYLECLGIAAIYNQGMRIAQGQAFAEARTEAKRALQAIMNNQSITSAIPIKKIKQYIGQLCSAHQKNSTCNLERVISDLERHANGVTQ